MCRAPGPKHETYPFQAGYCQFCDEDIETSGAWVEVQIAQTYVVHVDDRSELSLDADYPDHLIAWRDQMGPNPTTVSDYDVDFELHDIPPQQAMWQGALDGSKLPP
ncbi:hypothetical protein DVS28_a2938 [Euzebya pacifica]|uniref:Uncharacterized protein n=1 Tax=Euzebya pacifica TaxID=1608957 RepID=A0A346XZH0_9ACTN|nr:hypothetical protein [Euzebya pacifica]AXV07617.1 hypothetical protein DVS28_a2938 [Euzebya pacifica]